MQCVEVVLNQLLRWVSIIWYPISWLLSVVTSYFGFILYSRSENLISLKIEIELLGRHRFLLNFRFTCLWSRWHSPSFSVLEFKLWIINKCLFSCKCFFGLHYVFVFIWEFALLKSFKFCLDFLLSYLMIFAASVQFLL